MNIKERYKIHQEFKMYLNKLGTEGKIPHCPLLKGDGLERNLIRRRKYITSVILFSSTFTLLIQRRNF